jgi:prepilin-type N-terminal cleavage/methylation domain-containing protein
MSRGATLVELMVALAILGLLAGLGAATLGGWHLINPDARAEALSAARCRAIRTGARVRLSEASGESVLFLPDGRVVGGGMDPLTGASSDAAR